MSDNSDLLALAALINYKKVLMDITIAMDDQQDSDEEEEDLELNLRLLESNQKPIRITGYIINVVNHYDDIQFQQNFRLKRTTFERLLELISVNIIVHNQGGGRPTIEIKQQLLAVIWLLATPDSYRSVCERFNMAKSLLSKCFIQIVNALNSVITQIIKWPTGVELEAVKQKFESISIFKGLIGVVDGTYVPLSVPKKDAVAYTNRKSFTSMTLQANCDSQMRYTNVYCGWSSSVPDVRIFKNSDIFERAEENMSSLFPNGEFILGDKAYPLLEWCIPPYMDRGHMTQNQRNFNKDHSSCRQVIERSFALLFGRFRRLQKLDLHRTDWAPATITACCVLHNICIDLDGDLSQYITEGLPMQIANQPEDSTRQATQRNISENNGILKRDAICNQSN